MSKIRFIHFPVFGVLLAIMLMMGGEVKGQTRTYATGTITGGLIPKALLGSGSPYGITRNGSYLSHVGSITNILGIPNPNESNFYYLSTIKETSGSPTTVGSSDFLVNDNESFPAIVKANKTLTVVLLPLSGSNTFIQFRYQNPVASNTTTYFKLKEKPVRTGSLNLEVLNLLGLASNNLVVGEAFTNAMQPQDFGGSLIPLASPSIHQNVGSSIGTIAKPTKTELLIDKNGAWFAAVTPTAPGTYNSVRLTAQFPDDINILSGDNTISFNVYNAFTETGNQCSLRPSYTNDGLATGVKLNLGAISDALALSEILKDPQLAIDDDPSTYSAMSSGSVSVSLLSTISQKFYFDHKASNTDGVHIRLGLNNSLINLSLLAKNGIKFNFYNSGSDDIVNSIGLGDLSSLLGLKLGDLLNIGTEHKDFDFYYKPDQIFDRVEVEFDKGLLGIGLVSDALRIYDVSLVPTLPIITLQPNTLNSTSICEGNTASFSVAASVPSGGTSLQYQWQYYDGSNWNNIVGANSTTYVTEATTIAMNNRLYRVLIIGGNVTCPQTISSTPAKLTVNSITPGIISEDQTICYGTIPEPFTSSTAGIAIGNLTYQWQSSTDNLHFSDITSATSETYSESSVITQKTYYRRVATSTLNGKLCSANSNVIIVTTNPLPSISLEAIYSVCQGISNVSLIYFTPIADPKIYSIIWDNNAHDAGFTDVTGAILPSTSSINISIPGTADVTTYNGSVIVKNDDGCTSNPINFKILVNVRPTAPHIESH